MPEIDLNKAISRLDLPTFTYDGVKFKVRSLNKTESLKIESSDDSEARIDRAKNTEELVAAMAATLDILVEPVVKTGKGGRKLGALVIADFEAERIDVEEIIALRFAILGAKETALRPT